MANRSGNPNPIIPAKGPRNIHTNGVNASLPDAYHNDVDTEREIVKELPQHRNVVLLSATGHNLKEIQAQTGYTTAHISRIIRQPWARAMIQKEQRHTVIEEVNNMFKRGAEVGYSRLLKLADTAESESVQADSAKYLVNRFYGQPTQSIENVSKPASQMTDDELKASLDSVLRAEGPAPSTLNEQDGNDPSPLAQAIKEQEDSKTN